MYTCTSIKYLNTYISKIVFSHLSTSAIEDLNHPCQPVLRSITPLQPTGRSTSDLMLLNTNSN